MSYTTYSVASEESRVRTLFNQVYAWMAAGLLVTGALASVTAGSEFLVDLIYGTPLLLFVLILAELGLVVWLSARINKLSPAAATAIFMAYSALNGLTLAWVFLVYTSESVASTFFVTAGTFGAMSIVGFVTKADLSKLGSILTMALVGLILASIVNIFFANSTLYWIITYAGVLIFVGLIVYDTQKLKNLSTQVGSETEMGRLAIMGALSLYLDFINLFLFLLRIFGRRR